MQKAQLIWERSVRDFKQLGLPPMTGQDIADRCFELSTMEAEIDEKFNDNEVMRASYQLYLKQAGQPD